MKSQTAIIPLALWIFNIGNTLLVVFITIVMISGLVIRPFQYFISR